MVIGLGWNPRALDPEMVEAAKSAMNPSNSVCSPAERSFVF